MSTEPALLAAVCAAPDDDLPRLVFADWCEENGRPERAEFIRSQIELAKLSRDSKRRRALAFRCRQLIDTAEDHLHNLPDTLPPEPWSFRRGFVELLEVEGMHLDDEAEMFRTHPVRRLHSVNLCEIDDLKHIPTDNHLLTLTLAGSHVTTADLVQLSRMKRFPHLTELGLMFCELDDEAARVLCDRAFFQRLKVLRFGGNPFTDAGRQLLRDHYGERVSFVCERDPEYLYAITDEDFTVGHGRDHTQLLMLAGPDDGSVAVFDHAGNLLRVDEKPGRGKADPHEVKERWMEEYGGECGTIRVKRFKFPNGIGIEDFVPWRTQVLENPDDPEREDLLLHHGGWLADGMFRWNWGGDDWWLNRDGNVTDT